AACDLRPSTFLPVSARLRSPVSSHPEHRLHGARDIRLAASGDVAARRKLGRYRAQLPAGLVAPRSNGTPTLVPPQFVDVVVAAAINDVLSALRVEHIASGIASRDGRTPSGIG